VIDGGVVDGAAVDAAAESGGNGAATSAAGVVEALTRSSAAAPCRTSGDLLRPTWALRAAANPAP